MGLAFSAGTTNPGPPLLAAGCVAAGCDVAGGATSGDDSSAGVGETAGDAAGEGELDAGAGILVRFSLLDCAGEGDVRKIMIVATSGRFFIIWKLPSLVIAN
jgi:hypothetical protein